MMTMQRTISLGTMLVTLVILVSSPNLTLGAKPSKSDATLKTDIAPTIEARFTSPDVTEVPDFQRHVMP